MLIETIEKTIKSNISKENKRLFLRKEIPSFINELFQNKDIIGIEKLFIIINSLSKDINKNQEIDFLFSNSLFKATDVETFNSILKNKKILAYFEDNSDILANGIFTGDIKNVFALYKRLKHPIFFSETKIYKYQHQFPFCKVSKFYKDLYQILQYSSGEEPLYVPYFIILHAIQEKNVLLLELGFDFLDTSFKQQKVFLPILWSIYAKNNLPDLIFLETNQDLLKGIQPCYADFLCEFLPDYLYQNSDELKFFNYVVSHSQEQNKETVIMLLNHLKKINLHFKNFYFIFAFYNYLRSSKNGRLYILEEIIHRNGVLELIEIIQD